MLSIRDETIDALDGELGGAEEEEPLELDHQDPVSPLGEHSGRGRGPVHDTARLQAGGGVTDRVDRGVADGEDDRRRHEPEAHGNEKAEGGDGDHDGGHEEDFRSGHVTTPVDEPLRYEIEAQVDEEAADHG